MRRVRTLDDMVIILYWWIPRNNYLAGSALIQQVLLHMPEPSRSKCTGSANPVMLT